MHVSMSQAHIGNTLKPIYLTYSCMEDQQTVQDSRKQRENVFKNLNKVPQNFASIYQIGFVIISISSLNIFIHSPYNMEYLS